MTGRFRVPLNILYSSIRHPLQKMEQQLYDCFLVLDFEATCEEKVTIPNQEIIEFPVLKVDAKTCSIVSQFHEYIRPTRNPELTTFCTKLTGITQEMVDKSEAFPQVFDRFKSWMNESVAEQFMFVTCGDWDLKSMLPEQCAMLDIEVPSYLKSYANVKQLYAEATGTFPKGMSVMLHSLNLKHIGRHHSGIDDCRNITNILVALVRQGIIVRPTKPTTSAHSKKKLDSTLLQPQQNESYRHIHSIAVPPPLSDASINKPTIVIPSSAWQSQRWSKNIPALGSTVGSVIQQHSGFEDKKEGCSIPPDTLASHPNDGDTRISKIIDRLMINISKYRFEDRKAIDTLLIAAKFLNDMEYEDRKFIHSQLKFYDKKLCFVDNAAFMDTKFYNTYSGDFYRNSEYSEWSDSWKGRTYDASRTNDGRGKRYNYNYKHT